MLQMSVWPHTCLRDTVCCHSKIEFTFRRTRRQSDGTEARNEKEIRKTASPPPPPLTTELFVNKHISDPSASIFHLYFLPFVLRVADPTSARPGGLEHDSFQKRMPIIQSKLETIATFNAGVHKLPKQSNVHFKILGAIQITRSKVHTDEPQN
jgi:hypothetical protein